MKFGLRNLIFTLLYSSSFLLLVSCNSSEIKVTLNQETTDNSSNSDLIVPPVVITSADVIASLENYILVPGNVTLGTNDFYIMKYEAKAWEDDNVDDVVDVVELDPTDWTLVSNTWTANDLLTLNHIPVSNSNQAAWDNTAEDAWDLCDALNSEGTRGNIDDDINLDGTFALTSNPEWMTMARNIEVQPSNWTSGVVGTGCLKRGNIGGDRNLHSHRLWLLYC